MGLFRLYMHYLFSSKLYIPNETMRVSGCLFAFSTGSLDDTQLSSAWYQAEKALTF